MYTSCIQYRLLRCLGIWILCGLTLLPHHCLQVRRNNSTKVLVLELAFIAKHLVALRTIGGYYLNSLISETIEFIPVVVKRAVHIISDLEAGITIRTSLFRVELHGESGLPHKPELPESSRTEIFGSEFTDEGTTPFKLLELRSRYCKCLHLPISFGIDPTSLLLLRINLSNFPAAEHKL